MNTRCKDKTGKTIVVGDILHVEEYPGEYVGGSLDFEGVVTIEGGSAVVTYYDIGEKESYLVSRFPIKGRHIWDEKGRYDYWKTAMLGEEPPEYLWKENLYVQYFEDCEGEE